MLVFDPNRHERLDGGVGIAVSARAATAAACEVGATVGPSVVPPLRNAAARALQVFGWQMWIALDGVACCGSDSDFLALGAGCGCDGFAQACGAVSHIPAPCTWHARTHARMHTHTRTHARTHAHAHIHARACDMLHGVDGLGAQRDLLDELVTDASI